MPANRAVGNLIGVAPGVWNGASQIQVGAEQAPYVTQTIHRPLPEVDASLVVMNGATGTTATSWNMDVTFDYPRALFMTITGGANIARTVTVTGLDGYNMPIVASNVVTANVPLNASDHFTGKAFKRVTNLTISSAYPASVTIVCRASNVFGLRYPFMDREQVGLVGFFSIPMSARYWVPGDGTTLEDPGNFQPGTPAASVFTPYDATIQLDPRGTYETFNDPDGQRSYKVFYMAQNLDSIFCESFT